MRCLAFRLRWSPTLGEKGGWGEWRAYTERDEETKSDSGRWSRKCCGKPTPSRRSVALTRSASVGGRPLTRLRLLSVILRVSGYEDSR